MTNEDLLADLKQFIEATVSQQMSQFATKEDLAKLATKDDLKSEIQGVERRLGARLDVLDEKIDVIQDAIADTVQDHEQRLRRLEQRTA